MRWCYVFCLFFLGILTQAQECHNTDRRTQAQQDDLVGPVKSVFTKVKGTNVQWQQPGGPSLNIPISCFVCEYDRDGVRTKAGSVVDGNFIGQTIQFIRDDQGRVTDQLVINTNGQLDSHKTIGAFGRTEQTDYVEGKIFLHQKFSYDRCGRSLGLETFDGTGRQKSKIVITRQPDGALTSQSVWGQNGQLNFQNTFDPATATEHFTSFSESGIVTLTFTVIKGQLTSFWELPGSESHFGDNFNETDEDGDSVNYACSSTDKCDISRVHYEYLNPQEKRNPISAEWKDSDGNLRYAVYYDYETDAFNNWTSRQVWVWSTEMKKRELSESDSREITYWNK